jgi:hypothetical protein
MCVKVFWQGTRWNADGMNLACPRGFFPVNFTYKGLIMAIINSSPISQDKTLKKNILQDNVNSILWKAYDTFRSNMDPTRGPYPLR